MVKNNKTGMVSDTQTDIYKARLRYLLHSQIHDNSLTFAEEGKTEILITFTDT